jgi:hypothetical protein
MRFSGGSPFTKRFMAATCDVAVDAQQRPLFTCYPTNATEMSVMRLLPSGQSDLAHEAPGYSSGTEGCSPPWSLFAAAAESSNCLRCG